MPPRKKAINEQVDNVVGIVDSLNLSTTFIMMLTEVLERLVDEMAKFVLYPVSIVTGLLKAGLAWRQAYLNKGDNGAVVSAVVQTVSAVAMGIITLGGLVASAIFAAIAPFAFTLILAAKTLFHFGASIYHGVQSLLADTEYERNKHRAAAKEHLIGTVALTLATIAIAAVTIFAKPIVGILGIIAGVIGAAYSLYNVLTTTVPDPLPKSFSPSPIPAPKGGEGPSVSAKLHQKFVIQNALSSSVDIKTGKEVKRTTTSLWNKSTACDQVRSQKHTEVSRRLTA